ncbi:transposase [Acinetobacter baumannii]
MINEQNCGGCEKVVDKFKKRYKADKYCSTCYARIFKKRLCPSCGEEARLPKNDDQAICNQCIKKQPCIRCNQIDKPIGKITEYGLVCNSCSVYFRPIERCERCDTPTQLLTKISRFGDDLRVCQKCATRDYETCPSCHKYRFLEQSDTGVKICKKCRDESYKKCVQCSTMLPAGYSDLCDNCYWHKNLWQKAHRNIKILQYSHLQSQYENYVNWLESKVGANKAALYINKHTHFFIKTEELWAYSIPTAEQLLALLRTSGLRRFELVVDWLYDTHNISFSLEDKDFCSQMDQIDKLVATLLQPSTAYEVILAYKSELYGRMKNGKTNIRSLKLAMKPAVMLMHYTCASNDELPNLEHVKEYLIKFSGQAAALTGFINFLNKNYDTSIDYVAFKKSRFLNEKRKQNLENEIVGLMKKELINKKDILDWARNGLRYFHNMSYLDTLKIKIDMIIDAEDGYTILFHRQSYWLPKNTDNLIV